MFCLPVGLFLPSPRCGARQVWGETEDTLPHLFLPGAAPDASLGSLTVSPPSGIALETPFLVSSPLTSWANESWPLEFEVSYVVVGDERQQQQPVVVSSFRPASAVSVVLPAGVEAAGAAVEVLVAVRNAAGVVAAEPLRARVAVRWPDGATEQGGEAALVGSAAAQARSAALLGQPDRALALLTGAASLLNSRQLQLSSPPPPQPPFSPPEQQQGGEPSSPSPPLAPPPPGSPADAAAQAAEAEAALLAERSQQREALMGALSSAAAALPASADSFRGVSAAVAAVVDSSDPRELSAATRAAALSLLGGVASGGELGPAAVTPQSAASCAAALDSVSRASLARAAAAAAAAGPRSGAAGRCLRQEGGAADADPSRELAAVTSVLESLAGSLAAAQRIPDDAPAEVSSAAGGIALSVSLSSATPASPLFQGSLTAAGAAASFDPLPFAAIAPALPPNGAAVRVQFLSTPFNPYSGAAAADAADGDVAGGGGGAGASLVRLQLSASAVSSGGWALGGRGSAAAAAASGEGRRIDLAGLQQPILFSMPSAPGAPAQNASAACRCVSDPSSLVLTALRSTLSRSESLSPTPSSQVLGRRRQRPLHPRLLRPPVPSAAWPLRPVAVRGRSDGHPGRRLPRAPLDDQRATLGRLRGAHP